MRNLNSRLLLAAAASIGMTAIASAADLPARTWTKAPMMDTPACAWCGWYVGGNGGFAFGNTTGNLTSSDVGFGSTVALGLIPTALGAKHDGGYGGGQFGYNFVTSNVLIGFEADIQGANIGSANTISLTNGTDSTSATTGRDRIDWFGTARGRLGYSFGSVVLFGTGGLAFGGVGSQIQNNIAINGLRRSGQHGPFRRQHGGRLGRGRGLRMDVRTKLELQDRIPSRRSRKHGPGNGRIGWVHQYRHVSLQPCVRLGAPRHQLSLQRLLRSGLSAELESAKNHTTGAST